jgi:hypothetical protein
MEEGATLNNIIRGVNRGFLYILYKCRVIRLGSAHMGSSKSSIIDLVIFTSRKLAFNNQNTVGTDNKIRGRMIVDTKCSDLGKVIRKRKKTY